METHISVSAAVLRNNVIVMFAMGIKPCEIAAFIRQNGACTEEEKKDLLAETHLEEK